MTKMLFRVTIIFATMIWISGCNHIKVQTKDGKVPLNAYLENNEIFGRSVAINAGGSMGKAEVTEFNPSLKSPADFDKHVETVRKKQGEIVKDKHGTYVFFVGENLEKTTISAIDGEQLKVSIRSGSGLLFPIYEYYFDRQGWPRLRPNWEATEVRHAFLSNELKLRLLPLKSTREAHDALLKISVSRGGYGWGGDEIYKDLFYSIGRKPEYIVTGFGIQQWFRLVNLDYSKDLKERYTVAADFYKPADLFGPAGSDFLTDRQIIFETTEKAMSLRSGKADLATGCLTLNIAKYRKHINDYDVKVNMNSYIEQLKVNMREFNKTESAVNVACGRAFNILQIGGAEVSNTLK